MQALQVARVPQMASAWIPNGKDEPSGVRGRQLSCIPITSTQHPDLELGLLPPMLRNLGARCAPCFAISLGQTSDTGNHTGERNAPWERVTVTTGNFRGREI